jgi:dUTP pyrophosphatase
MAILQVQLLKKEARIPTRSTLQSAGCDVYTIAPVTLIKGERIKIPLGIALSPPAGTYLRLASRSGLALQGVDVVAGVIDADYRGEVNVVLVNTKEEPITFEAGTRIAQLICEKILYPGIVKVEQLESTQRGSGNFGSTGLVDTATVKNGSEQEKH